MVDGEEAILQPTARLLRRVGYEVSAVPGGDPALELLADPSRPVAVLVTDLSLPGMRGEELAARALGFRPGLRVIFVCGAEGPEDLAPEWRRANVRFLRRPFTIVDLAAEIGESLTGDISASFAY